MRWILIGLLAGVLSAQVTKPKCPATISALERWVARLDPNKPVDVATISRWIEKLTPPASKFTTLELQHTIVMLRRQLAKLVKIQRLRRELDRMTRDLAEAMRDLVEARLAAQLSPTTIRRRIKVARRVVARCSSRIRKSENQIRNCNDRIARLRGTVGGGFEIAELQRMIVEHRRRIEETKRRQPKEESRLARWNRIAAYRGVENAR
jgi:chromosome segregation ATPase